MEIRKFKISFKDKRGKIADIIVKDRIEYVTWIFTKKGAVRANHYHKKTFQYNYLLSGKMKLISKMPGEKAKSIILKPGSLVINTPNEHHGLKALEDSELMVFTRGLRGGRDYELDTYRLKDKLIK